ncbi:hypothetical protein BRADO1268 [Bradyrhizobium sp. ORS 278]|nr:hypothetical protein BRADO1268 [Bradyrhizobium sp. ORS 278]
MMRAQIPRRPLPSVGGSKSRTEAATEIVRLEYERERLAQAVAQYLARYTSTLEALKGVDKRIQYLMERNALGEKPTAVAKPAPPPPRRRNG